MCKIYFAKWALCPTFKNKINNSWQNWSNKYKNINNNKIKGGCVCANVEKYINLNYVEDKVFTSI